MSHIHTKSGQHDVTASGFIIRLDGPEPAVVLHKHKKLRKWVQFGGHVELDENPWQAVAHEIREESGYTLDELKILQPALRLKAISGNAILHPVPAATLTCRFADSDHFHTDTAYAFVAQGPAANTVAAGESTDIKSFTAKQLAQIPASDIMEDAREIGLFVLESCLIQWVTVDATSFSQQLKG